MNVMDILTGGGDESEEEPDEKRSFDNRKFGSETDHSFVANIAFQ